MNMQIFWQCLFAGFCFGVWPCFTRTGNIPAAWLSVFFAVGSLLVSAVYMGMGGREPITLPQIWRGILAGTVNGAGFVVYGMLIKNQSALDRAADLSSIIPTVTVIVTLVGAGIAFATLHEPITLRKIAGITLAIVAVVLLQGGNRG